MMRLDNIKQHGIHDIEYYETQIPKLRIRMKSSLEGFVCLLFPGYDSMR